MSQEHDEGYSEGYNDAINEVLQLIQTDLDWYKKATIIDAHVIGKNVTESLLDKVKDLKL